MKNYCFECSTRIWEWLTIIVIYSCNQALNLSSKIVHSLRAYLQANSYWYLEKNSKRFFCEKKKFFPKTFLSASNTNKQKKTFYGEKRNKFFWREIRKFFERKSFCQFFHIWFECNMCERDTGLKFQKNQMKMKMKQKSFKQSENAKLQLNIKYWICARVRGHITIGFSFYL